MFKVILACDCPVQPCGWMEQSTGMRSPQSGIGCLHSGTKPGEEGRELSRQADKAAVDFEGLAVIVVTREHPVVAASNTAVHR